MSSAKKRESAIENGKLGGRPQNLVVVVSGGVARPVGAECSAPVDLGGGCWMFQEVGGAGRRWVLPVDVAKAPEGRYAARYVPKGKTPFDVARDSLVRVARLPGERVLFGFMENGHGRAYYPADFHGGNPAEVLRALRADWEARGREQWARAGWPIEREKESRDSRADLLPMVERIELELGAEWGEILRSWIARGRVFPHPWGEGRRAWIAERLRRADPLGGFDV